ncbi:MAG: radical SAM protein [bacterium]|nr:radical SAM protein [bacterium]
MKKMMFIRPPFKGMGRYVPPHLGIATLYNYLHDKFDWIEFSFVDALADALDEEQIIKAINCSRPDIIAITIKTMQARQAKEIIEKVKGIYNPLVICGGNHVSVSPQEFVRCGADYAVVGEGEEAIEKIILYEFCNSEEPLDECINICTKNSVERNIFEPKVCINGSNIPAPDWSIFDLSKYNENIHLNKSRPALPVMASRGCPFKCDFCSTHLTWTTKVRYRNPIDVFNEIKNNQIKWGISDYHFYDDNLLINPEWVDQFTELIISTGLNVNWICLSRPEIILKHKELLPKMKKAGCKGFELGFETDDDGLYLTMNKKNVKSTFRKAYEYLCGVDFEMIEFLVMSFYVGETLQSLYRTNEVLRQYKKQKALFVSSRYFATPFKGTPYYNIAMESGIDLYPGDEYRYAVFLNYMPKSFLESEMKDYTISARGLRLQFDFFGIENLMYSNAIERIMQHVPLEQFAQLFNDLSSEGKKVADLCSHIHSLVPDIDVLPVYEYVGRLIEFCASSGIMKKQIIGECLNEDSSL